MKIGNVYTSAIAALLGGAMAGCAPQTTETAVGPSAPYTSRSEASPVHDPVAEEARSLELKLQEAFKDASNAIPEGDFRFLEEGDTVAVDIERGAYIDHPNGGRTWLNGMWYATEEPIFGHEEPTPVARTLTMVKQGRNGYIEVTALDNGENGWVGSGDYVADVYRVKIVDATGEHSRILTEAELREEFPGVAEGISHGFGVMPSE